MQIFNEAQLKLFDKNVMKNQKLASEALMYRAASACTRWLLAHKAAWFNKFVLFCGVGNNGGDGLVIALQLAANGFEVQLHLVEFSQNYSDDFKHYFRQVHEAGIPVNYIKPDSPFPEIDKNALLIDAIFGYGLHRPPEVWVEQVFKKINQLSNDVIAIDLPSGLYCDAPVAAHTVIQADETLTLVFPKLSFLLPQTGIYTGQWHLMSLGEQPEDYRDLATDYAWQTPADLAVFLKERPRFSHKGSFGHAVIVGGSYGKIGAALLAAKAALKSGCGLVSAFTPGCGYIPFQSALPEAMLQTDLNEHYITEIKPEVKQAVFGVGMGMGTHPETVKALEAFFKSQKQPMVLDADALNILSANQVLLDWVPENTILTPHPGELERLIGKTRDDFERLEKTRQWARKLKSIILIKGAYTAIVTPDKIWFNATGNPGMATAGSGDVLAGILTGLLAQGYAPIIAARLGVLLHGLAGDLAAQKHTEPALTASDITENLGDAYRAIAAKRT